MRIAHPATDQIIILGVVLLSWGLLTWQLDQRSLWIDEFLTLQTIQGTVSDIVLRATGDIHPPLYFLAARVWTILAGSSDFVLRWFSAAIGVIGLALMAAFARQWAGPRAAVPATLLLGLAPAFIEFSRMARYYSLLLSLGLLSTKLLFDAASHHDWKRWIAYAMTGLALLYTFYPGGLLLIAHGLVIILPARQKLLVRRWLVAVLIVGIGLAPWLHILESQVADVTRGTGADLARSGLGFVLGIAASAYTFGVGETIFPWQPEAWIGLTIAAVLIGLSLRKQSGHRSWQPVGLFAVGIISVAVVTTSIATGTPFLNVPVRGLFALPYFLLAIVLGLISITSRIHRAAVGGALLAVWVVSLFNNFTGQQFLNPIYITPAKEAAAYVRQHATPADLVVSDYDSVFSHYFLTGEPLLRHLFTDEEDEIQAVLKRAQPEHVWLITIGRDQTRHDLSAQIVRRRLAANYYLERVERYLPIDPIYLQVKEFLLRRDVYEHRLTIELHAHRD